MYIKVAKNVNFIQIVFFVNTLCCTLLIYLKSNYQKSKLEPEGENL